MCNDTKIVSITFFQDQRNSSGYFQPNSLPRFFEEKYPSKILSKQGVAYSILGGKGATQIGTRARMSQLQVGYALYCTTTAQRFSVYIEYSSRLHTLQGSHCWFRGPGIPLQMEIFQI